MGGAVVDLGVGAAGDGHDDLGVGRVDLHPARRIDNIVVVGHVSALGIPDHRGAREDTFVLSDVGTLSRVGQATQHVVLDQARGLEAGDLLLIAVISTTGGLADVG